MSRRLTNRRGAAAAVTSGALAVAGFGAVALAPAAQADTVHATVHCTPPIVPPADGPQDITVTLSPATAAPGSVVHATVTLGPSPATSPIALTNIPATPSITLAMHGGASGNVTITGATTPISVPAQQPIQSPPYSGDFTVPASATGTVTFTPTSMLTQTDLSSMGFGIQSTPCTVTSGQDQTVASLAVQGGTSGNPTLTAATASTHTGDNVTLTGSNFAPSAAATVKLCATDGTNCDGSNLTGNTVAIDASGNLTGTVSLGTGIADGDYVLQVSDGSHSASTGTIHITTFVPTGAPVLSMTPTSGPVGTVVTITGGNLPPNVNAKFNGVDASGNIASRSVYGQTDGDGNLAPTQYTIVTANTAGIKEWVPGGPQDPVVLPFSIGIDQTQTATVALNPGSLSMTQAGSGIDFGSATLNGTAQKLTAHLDEVTVTDARGGNLGWTLTGTMTDLTAANGTDKIPAGSVSWTPACTPSATSLSTVTTGAPGALGSTPATLCAQAADATKATGGNFKADAGLTLTTPEFAAAGTYTGTLTLSLS